MLNTIAEYSEDARALYSISIPPSFLFDLYPSLNILWASTNAKSSSRDNLQCHVRPGQHFAGYRYRPQDINTELER